MLNVIEVKGIVQVHPNENSVIVPNLFDFLLWNTKEGILMNVVNHTSWWPLSSTVAYGENISKIAYFMFYRWKKMVWNDL